MTYYINPKGMIASRGKYRNITYVERWTEMMMPEWFCKGENMKSTLTPEMIENIIKEENWKKIDMRTARKIIQTWKNTKHE